jgi:hypothetical protein
MMDRDRPVGEAAQGAAKKRMFQVLEEIERRIRDAGKNAKLIEGQVVDACTPAGLTIAVEDQSPEPERAAPASAGMMIAAQVPERLAVERPQPSGSTMAERLAARRREGVGPQQPDSAS